MWKDRILLCEGETSQGETGFCYAVEMTRQAEMESCYLEVSHVCLHWRTQDVRGVQKALHMEMYSLSPWSRFGSQPGQAQDVRVVREALQEFSRSRSRLVSLPQA